MKDIFIVMKFTILDMVKRKAFIISTIVILLLIVGGFAAVKIFSGDGKVKVLTILVHDQENIFNNKLDNLNLKELGYKFSKTDKSIEDIKSKVNSDSDVDALIINKNKDGSIVLTYIVKNLFFSNGIPEDLANILSSVYTSNGLEKLNLTKEQIASLNPVFEYRYEQAGEEVKGNIAVMMGISIILFYAIYFCAFQVSSSITTEKTSKIIEMLVTSTSPRNIVLGKTLGIGIVGLCQLALNILTSFICARIFIDKQVLSKVVDLSTITVSLALITLLYFILGYLTYALLYALTGSTVSKPEDVQSANGPVAIIAVIGFYLSYFTMMNPTGKLNLLAALLPISSPFCMPLRIMMGLASYKEVILSVLILIITIIVVANISIKIYTRAILYSGSKLNFKKIIMLYKQK
ncbi:MAG: ABC transporter permease [Mollicutes bacterium]|nr:ABC transporter permease [Mollicutes bacterium]